MEQKLDLIWVLVCTVFVFLMQAGFCCIESGMCRSKNSINVAIKNVVDLCISGLLFWAFGFALMHGTSWHGAFGVDGFLFTDPSAAHWMAAFFLFQLAFCGTATTIASGAVAERMRFSAYLVLAAIIGGIAYPVFGHWAWARAADGQASGWLAKLGFIDFAGSTVVHSVGAWCALPAVLIIGARTGRFSANASPRKFPGHNLPMASLGLFVLWVGWFAFNGGSTLALNSDVPPILVRTFLAGASGGLASLAIQRCKSPVIAVEPLINGVLAGLVGITAGCHIVSAPAAILIGSIAAVAMECGAFLLERVFKLDDVVGAIPVHGFAGAWGTVAVAIFAPLDRLARGRFEQLGVQAIGVAVCLAWCFGVTWIVLRICSRFFALRVAVEEEEVGLNVAEHGATTEFYDLIQTMQSNAAGKTDIRAPIEPFTDGGAIALRYNEVLDANERTRNELVDEQRELILARQCLESQNDELESTLSTLQQAQADLLQSEKLASVGQLAAGIAHEINTPIQFVGDNVHACKDMFTDIEGVVAEYRSLLDMLEKDGRFVDVVARIRAAEQQADLDFVFEDAPRAFVQTLDGVKRVQKIVQAMKNFSHSGRGEHKAPFDLNEALRDTLIVANNELKYAADVTTDFGDLPNVEGSASELNQVFLNLLINAAHAIQDKGSERGTIDVRTRPDGEFVHVAISDTGCGIPDAIRQKIFDPFFTTKDVGRGSGQGLAIARNIIVDGHAGQLECESREGEGTTFHVRLPFASIEATTDEPLLTETVA